MLTGGIVEIFLGVNAAGPLLYPIRGDATSWRAQFGW